MTKIEEYQICEVKKFLESYGINKKMLRMMKYEKEYFSKESDSDDALPIPGGDEILIKSKMIEVRRFVAGLEDGNCKLLIFYHYIKGFSIEKCAEMMNIGRTSGFRLRRRALSCAAKIFSEKTNNKSRISSAA